MAVPKLGTHGPLRLLLKNDLVAVQPSDADGAAIETCSIDLSTGEVLLSEQPRLGAGAVDALALIGVLNLRGGTCVALVTGAEQVAILFDLPVYRITDVQVLCPKAAKFEAGEKRLVQLLQQGLSPSAAGRNIFFSYGGDLTLTAQERATALSNAANVPLCRRADLRFFWNRRLAQALMDAGALSFVLPMINGSVGQLAGIEASAHGRSVVLDISLIARRSADRSGTRHWRRGADFEGAAANFVESEQLVTMDDGRVVISHVQVRGSIPLVWTQMPNIKYKPPTRIAEGRASADAHDVHMADLLKRYDAVSIVNLVNQHGSEGLLQSRFADEAARYAREKAASLRYIAFDFHKECGATNYGRLSLMWDALSADFEKAGQFSSIAGIVEQRQSGVVRTNCIDCLDRTNVVQGLLGRRALERVLRHVGVLQEGEDLAGTLPEVEARYKIMWADHGDDISRQYAGTGALKSGFTRTGKRTVGGLVDDGVKSAMRYYLNNFQDGSKQDALDLLTGGYVPKPDVKLRFQAQHGPALPLLAAVAAFVYAARSLSAAMSGRQALDPQQLLLQVLAPLVLAAGLVMLVLRNGRYLVNRPQLCPAAANTVAAALSRAETKAE